MNKVVSNAKDYVSNALDCLEKLNNIQNTNTKDAEIKKIKAGYELWFGTFDQGRYLHVKSGYGKIQEELNQSFEWYKSNRDICAEMNYLTGRMEIGRYFWAYDDEREVTIIHELSHKVHGTGDIKALPSDCTELARTMPEDAIRNADNYGYYAENPK